MYPPIPYPPVCPPPVPQETPRPAKRPRATISPFSSPRPASTSPRTHSSPLKAAAPKPKPQPQRRTFKPLTPIPTANRTPTTSLAVQLTMLERKVQVLRLAKKYHEADQLGGEEGRSELEALCERWKEAGIAAATALWELVGSASPDPSFSNDQSSSFSGGWSSSYGFSTAPSSLHNNSPFESSWGWSSNRNTGFSQEEFSSRIEEEMSRSGRTRKDVLEELEKEGSDSGELESVEMLFERAERMRSKKRKVSVVEKVQKEIGEEKEEAEEEDDEIIAGLDELCEGEDAVMVDRDATRANNSGNQGAEPEEEDEELEAEKKEVSWSIGALLRTVGVEPEVFGWMDDAEDFSKIVRRVSLGSRTANQSVIPTRITLSTPPSPSPSPPSIPSAERAPEVPPLPTPARSTPLVRSRTTTLIPRISLSSSGIGVRNVRTLGRSRSEGTATMIKSRAPRVVSVEDGEWKAAGHWDEVLQKAKSEEPKLFWEERLGICWDGREQVLPDSPSYEPYSSNSDVLPTRVVYASTLSTFPPRPPLLARRSSLTVPPPSPPPTPASLLIAEYRSRNPLTPKPSTYGLHDEYLSSEEPYTAETSASATPILTPRPPPPGQGLG
ncbi:hypothetical protein P7C70_g8914, partial [Phenoliferia sp. Uapishka_3]